MRSRFVTPVVAVLCGFALGACRSTPKEAAPAAPGGDPMAEFAAWMEIQTPNHHHARMQTMVGDWDVVQKMWMVPGEEPMVSQATAKIVPIQDGRYIMHTYNGDAGGMPFSGTSIDGYDNIKGKYVSCWVDSMSTGLFFMEGTMMDSGKTIVSEGSVVMAPGQPPMVHRMVSHLQGPDGFVMEMFMVGPEGSLQKHMELTYSRRK